MDKPKKRRIRPLSKKHKFIKDGVFYAELNDYLAKELAEEGYAGCEVRVTPKSTEVIIHANRTIKVVGQDGRRVRELTALIEKRFRFSPGTIKIYAQRIKNRGLSALSQAEAVRYRLIDGLSVRRACYSVLKWIMDRGAKGCEVVISGKLRGQRAKSMKFREGYMIHAGDATNYYIDTAVKHVHLRQGVLGIKVKIMLPHKDDGKQGGGGVEKQLPDTIKILDPKEIDPEIDQMEQQTQQLGTLIHNQNQPIQPPMRQPLQQSQQYNQPPPDQQFNQNPPQQQPFMQQQQFNQGPPQQQQFNQGFDQNQGQGFQQYQ